MRKENPFYNRGPILDSGDFFGREKETAEALGLLRVMQNVSVVGPAKSGKTSFLFHLMREETQRKHGLDPSRLLPVYLSFEGLGDLTRNGWFNLLHHEIVHQGKERGFFTGQPAPPPRGEMSFLEL